MMMSTWRGGKARGGEAALPQPTSSTDLLDAVGEDHILRTALQKGYDVTEAVGGDDLSRLVDDRSAVDANDATRARLGGEHREDSGAATHVKHHLVAKEVAVVVDGIHVSLRADPIFEHLLMDAKVRVRVKVVVL